MKNQFLVLPIVFAAVAVGCARSAGPNISQPIVQSDPAPENTPIQDLPKVSPSQTPPDFIFTGKACNVELVSPAIKSTRHVRDNEHEIFKLRIRLKRNGSYQTLLTSVLHTDPSRYAVNPDINSEYFTQSGWVYTDDKILLMENKAIAAYLQIDLVERAVTFVVVNGYYKVPGLSVKVPLELKCSTTGDL